MAYTIGIDYGTNSVRSIVVRCADGQEVGSAVFDYPSGELGILLEPSDHNLARQHPRDYVLGLEESVRQAIADASARERGFYAQQVVGIGVDTTGSSPLPVDSGNVPLALKEEWKDELAAQCWLWKDHTSASEAADIASLGREHRPLFLAKCGNTYSSEWFWAKIWRCLKKAPEVFAAAHSWVELCDWIPSLLAGVDDPLKIRRSVCAAGHKGLYVEELGGLPDKAFLALLDPLLADLRDRLYEKAYDADTAAGTLCEEWGQLLSLPPGIPIAMGGFDAHYGAIGAGIEEGALVKIIGTSTCDCAVVKADRSIADIPGICGIVKGAILPGYYGIEAGQSAVGDIFAWFVSRICNEDSTAHQELAEQAEALHPGESGLLALDWNNGNRTILVDPLLTGLIMGQTLYTTRAEIYRALIEATAFGARMIIERMVDYGVPIETIVCAGGIAEKNPLLMQIYADATGCRIRSSASSQTCALGAAISAAVLAGSDKGGHSDFPAAQAAMTRQKEQAYHPDPHAQAVYNEIFLLYTKLHDSFGGVEAANLGSVMKRLLEIKDETRQSPSHA